MPDAGVEQPTDVVIKLTTTNICGSDLHMYEGRTDMEAGWILGHENLGEVVAVGKAVQRVKEGDLVCLPFNIGCGYCKNCERGYTGFEVPDAYKHFDDRDAGWRKVLLKPAA